MPENCDQDYLKGWVCWNNLHPMLGLWTNCMITDEGSPEVPRNNVRELLTFYDAAKFPLGPVCLRLDDLLNAMTNRTTYDYARTYCEACGHHEDGLTDTLGMYLTTYWAAYLNQHFSTRLTLSQWLAHHLDRLIRRECPRSSSNGHHTKLRWQTSSISVPPILILGITMNNLIHSFFHSSACRPLGAHVALYKIHDVS
jgi:hypothetical protein